MTQAAITTTDLPLKLVARGKVRDVYDSGLEEGEFAGALVFVATDRISAFDIILDNVSIFWCSADLAHERLLLRLHEKTHTTLNVFTEC